MRKTISSARAEFSEFQPSRVKQVIFSARIGLLHLEELTRRESLTSQHSVLHHKLVGAASVQASSSRNTRSTSRRFLRCFRERFARIHRIYAAIRTHVCIIGFPRQSSMRESLPFTAGRVQPRACSVLILVQYAPTKPSRKDAH